MTAELDLSAVPIGEVEAAINRCKAEHPFFDCILPKDVRVMSDVYGLMIYQRTSDLNLSQQTVVVQETFKKWLAL